MSAEELEKLQRDAQIERGKKSGKARRDIRPWPAHATALAKAAYKKDGTASNSTIANYIIQHWRHAAKCPSHGTLRDHVSELRKSGDLP